MDEWRPGERVVYLRNADYIPREEIPSGSTGGKRVYLADEVQKLALTEATYVPWGEWVQSTAFRRNVRGVLKFGAPLFWNVRVA
jgi:hypothetical protein